MPDTTPDTAAVYDVVLPTLLAAKYLLERLHRSQAHGRTRVDADLADLTAMVQHLAEAASLFHAWYTAHHDVP